MTVLGQHICHAKECKTVVPPKMFMCTKHWYMVPRYLQARIWAEYVPGQEIRKDPTQEYLTISQEAIDLVAKKEKK